MGDEVQDELDASSVCLDDEAIEASQLSKDGIDSAIVADVVAEIGHGRREDGRNP